MDWGEFGEKSMRFIATPIEKDARINILEGSVRSGKTVSMIPKWLRYIKYGPPGLLAMVGKSKDTLYDNVLRDMFETIGNDGYSYNRSTGNLNIDGRDIKVIGAKDKGSEDYIRGKTLAGGYIDEVTLTPENFFTQFLNRMSVEGAKLYATTNPDSPYHYIYKDYMTNQQLLADGDIKTYHFTLDDNPNLSQEYVTFIKRAYSGLFYKRMIEGKWVLALGAIYDMFDESRHVVSYKDLPKEYDRIIMGVDKGSGNPTTWHLIGVTDYMRPSQKLWVFDEYYHDPRKEGSKQTLDYKRDLMNHIGIGTKNEIYINAIYIDPSALDFINELKSKSLGYHFKNIGQANNAVLDGINSVATQLRNDSIAYCREKCPEIIRETVSYIWDEKAQLIGEDKPLKANDHCKDDERYAVHTEFPAVRKERLIA